LWAEDQEEAGITIKDLIAPYAMPDYPQFDTLSFTLMPVINIVMVVSPRKINL
jgi:hypothetical protein